MTTHGMAATPPRTSAQRRLRRAMRTILGDTAYIVSLWLLSLLAMLACLALLSLWLASTANADELDTELAQYETVAQQWYAGFGMTHGPCDVVNVKRADLFGARSFTVLYSAIPWTPSHCDVWFANELIEQPRPVVCATVLHEWGHVLGANHSSDPTNIMYDDQLVIPPVCQREQPRKGLAWRPLSQRHLSRAHMRARARHVTATVRR